MALAEVSRQSRPSSASSDRAKLKSLLADQFWRLNTLYNIEGKAGKIVKFRMNSSQEDLCRNMHYLNVILKARQLGFSTFIAMFFLDVCVFNSNTRCGVVDATIDDAKKKLGKIRLAYDMLPEWLKEAVPLKSSNAFKIEWANGSSIEVGTSHRGGTLQYLHISELGKIAAKYPEKAREIRTGALNTIQAGQVCFIESTAEGQEGDFFETCQAAEAKANMKVRLTPLDFKFHFYPWWKAAEYELDDHDGVVIPAPMATYFETLRKNAIDLTQGQKAWYVKKAETQRDDMKREYPSTPKEAFEASIEGAIYGEWIEAAEREGRIGEFPAIPGVPVHSFWDIGRYDYTSIWFVQILVGKVRVVGFYQNCLAGLPHYVEYMLGSVMARSVFENYTSQRDIKGIFADNGWIPGTSYWPHDGRVTEWGTDRTRIEQGKKGGLDVKIGVEQKKHDGINACRATIPLCEFDQAGCSEGLKTLKQYRWEWNEQRSCWMTGEPRHDTNSHGADAFRTLGTTWRVVVPALPPQPKPAGQLSYEIVGGSVQTNMTMQQIIAMKSRQAKEHS